VFYFAGLGVGAFGLERGLLSADSMLVRHWLAWLGGAFASFVLWMGLTAWAMSYPVSAPLVLQIVVNSSFALACASACLFVMAGCLRFGAVRSPLLESLAKNAFGIYLLHYVFVVWLQYALIGVSVFAFAKGMIVFAVSLPLAWAATAALRSIPFGALLIGERPERRSVRGVGRSHRRIWQQAIFRNTPRHASQKSTSQEAAQCR
jgi:membrane-bound acyltransferase YfiQ involved in biofilm formation